MRTTLERLRARKGDEEGFTLIELLIVIIILAILATIVIFAVGTTTKNAAVASCKSTVKSVETAVESYKAQTGTYPATITALATTTTTRTPTNPVGPWLRTVPHATVGKNHYAIALAATGVVNVKYTTAGTTVTKTADGTPTPCLKA